MKKALQSMALTSYGAIARTGLMKWPPARRAFLVLYAAYKTWIESGPVDRLRDYVPAGSLVVDIGANVGFFTMKFARWVGPTGRVIAVEPDIENFIYLETMIAKANYVSRVTTKYGAAASQDGVLRLHRNELHPGDHRLALDGQGVEIAAFAINSLVLPNDVSRVSLIKIDVQGAEMLVLNGAWRVIETARPALFVELDDTALRSFGTSTADILDAMEARNYAPFQLLPKGAPQRLARNTILNNVAHDYIDVLFLPE